MAVSENQDYYEEGKGGNPQNFPMNPAPTKMGDTKDTGARVHYGTVINVPLCTLLNRRVLELKECYIALYETFVIYKVIAKYEEPINDGETEGEWKALKANYRWTRARRGIVSVEMFYSNIEGLWVVNMQWAGAGEYNWHFLLGADAKKLHDILQNYFITRDIKPEQKPDTDSEKIL